MVMEIPGVLHREPAQTALLNARLELFGNIEKTGTGLGLSISYGIVQDCGGSIQVVPNKPEGACFVLKFPLQETNDETENTPRR